MAIMKYLRVGDTAELQDNGIRWIRIPSHVATGKMSGVIYESEDGTPVYTWWTDAHVMMYKVTEPSTESDGSTVSAAADAQLTAIAGLTPAADKFIVWDSSTAATMQTVTTAAQGLLDDADTSTMRTTLGLAIGTNVQAWDAQLDTWSGVTPSANAQTFVAAANYSAMRTALGVEIASDVQAYDAGLTNLAAVTMAANQYYYTSGDNTHVAAGITANGRSLVAAADYAAMLALLSGDASATFAWNSQSLSGVNDLGAVTGTFSGAISTTSAVVNSDITIGTGSIISASGAISFGNENLTTQGDIHLDLDDAELQLGDATTDATIKFDGTDLVFYDTNSGSKTLGQLASQVLDPTVGAGEDFTITEGKFNWTNSAAEIAGAWAFSNTTTDSIDITAASLLSGNLIHIVADAVTTGKVLHIQSDHSGAAGAHIYLDWLESGGDADGRYLVCYDGTGDVLTIKKDGAVAIAGSATGTDALTITAGDITLSDGVLNVTDSTNSTTATITDNFQTTTGNLLLLTSSSLTSATALKIDCDAGAAGLFIDCDNSGSKFSVDIDDGNVLIAGTDGSDAVTLTKGNIKITDGVIDADADSAMGHNFATAQAGTAVSPLITLINSNASYDKPMLYIDAIASGAINAVEIDYIGAAASAVDIGLEAATSDGLKVEATVASWTGQGLVVDCGTWVGTADQGVIDIRSDDADRAQSGHAIYVKLQGHTTASGAAVDGSGLYLYDKSATKAGTYVAYINSVSNAALHVAAGVSQYDVDCHITGGTAAGSTGVDLQFFGDTAGRFVKWDSANDQFQLGDGTTTFKFENGSTLLDIDGSAANDILNFGKNTDMDVVFHGTTAGADVEWDASDDELSLLANAKLNLDGALIMSGTQTITDGTAPDVLHPMTFLDTDPGGAQATALADGVEGQQKYILMTADAGDFVITPTNFEDNTITFDDADDFWMGIFAGAEWKTIAATATVA